MKNHAKHTEMLFDYKLIKAEFLQRPNRFLTRVKINGSTQLSHLPDPGRLKELLIPGVTVLIKKEEGNSRKTAYSTQMVYSGETLVSINSWLPNAFAAHLLHHHQLSFYKDWTVIQREIVHSSSRFDFLLGCGEEKYFLEVKSVTYAENRTAKFPDAVTSRGAKHLNHLAQIAKDGGNSGVLFLVQREDVDSFEPFRDRDPVLANSLSGAVNAGVDMHVIRCSLSHDRIRYLGEIPYSL